jgi:hypothetical protein
MYEAVYRAAAEQQLRADGGGAGGAFRVFEDDAAAHRFLDATHAAPTQPPAMIPTMNTPDSLPPPASVPPTGPPMSAEQLQADLNTIRSVLSESAAAKGPHRLIIAAGNLVCGAFMLLAVPIVILVFCIPIFNVPETEGMVAVILIGLIAVGVLVALAVPFLLAGWGLLKSRSWGPRRGFVVKALREPLLVGVEVFPSLQSDAMMKSGRLSKSW